MLESSGFNRFKAQLIKNKISLLFVSENNIYFLITNSNYYIHYIQ